MSYAASPAACLLQSNLRTVKRNRIRPVSPVAFSASFKDAEIAIDSAQNTFVRQSLADAVADRPAYNGCSRLSPMANRSPQTVLVFEVSGRLCALPVPEVKEVVLLPELLKTP